MNKLDTKTRALILRLLVEGSSIRATCRIADVSKNTVVKLLADAGRACLAYHEAHVRGVASKRIQCDEILVCCYAKEKNVPTAKAAPANAGDVWTWTALDPDSKLIVSYAVGDRDAETARDFMFDLAERLVDRVQRHNGRLRRLPQGRGRRLRGGRGLCPAHQALWRPYGQQGA